LRQFFHWRRSGLRFINEPKDHLFAHLSGENQKKAHLIADRLLKDYQLLEFFQQSEAENYRENLFYLELIERALETTAHTLPSPIKAADIGVSHWFYVQALHALLTRWRNPKGRVVSLDGYETDAYRVYNDFYSRYDHALAHIRQLENVNYIPEPFQLQHRMYDFISILFPFVFLKDHARWGLPKHLFEPERLIKAAWSSLKQDGVLIIVNQGAEENQAQQEILHTLDIQPLTTFKHDSLMFKYQIPRYVLIACRAK
jgi:hypothetical protein